MTKKIMFVVCLALALTLLPSSHANAATTSAYNYQVISQSAYPSTLGAGQTTNVWIDVKNTGTRAWDQNVRLGSGSALYGGNNNDYTSEFYDAASWLSANRPVAIDKTLVNPGETARFQFNIKTPLTSGIYKAYFTPVIDGVAWMKDVGIYWQITVSGGSTQGFQKVTSANDFTSYLSANASQSFGNGNSVPLLAPAPTTAPPTGAQSGTINRTSETNVQVAGIDEPDMVKVNGENIFYSQKGFFYPYTYKAIDGVMPPYQDSEWTKIIGAFPASTMSLQKSLDKGGDLLLDKDNGILMVFDNPNIIAYDISDITNPVQKWTIALQGNTYIDTARFYNGKMYLITKEYLNSSSPCVITPFMVNGVAAPVICTDFYRPTVALGADTLFTASVINPLSGSIDKKTNFIGSDSDSEVYMSENALYISYSTVADYATFYVGFIKAEMQNMLPADTYAHIAKVYDYDISDTAKQAEFDYVINKYTTTLSNDDANAFQTNLNNRLTNYVNSKVRDLEKTTIAKIGLTDFTLSATGTVPGYLLNQFSMDEYQGNLRIATTVGGRFYWGSTTANDVYVLDSSMNQVGSILGLGLTEKVYSARFVGSKGYLVTFRQVDPFYILDLSNPAAPKVSGQIKIPGYSSYLHPINDNLVIGIGMENNQVKVSLFDVTDPANPIETDKYYLNEYWTDIQNNHHAFLLDTLHSVFFIPGGISGYVLSYAGNKLTLEKAVSDAGIKRAVYINDTLYMISDSKITAYDETTWEKTGEFAIQ